MRIISFDLELAKEIHAGRREGLIVTRAGRPVEILKFDANTIYGNIIFIAKCNDRGDVIPQTAYNNGHIYYII